jgi:hypothetical protein
MSKHGAHPHHANVVLLRPSYREALEAAGARFDAAVCELDRVLSRVRDDVAHTIRAGRVAVRAGRLAFQQELRRDRVRGPVGLVDYGASNSR